MRQLLMDRDTNLARLGSTAGDRGRRQAGGGTQAGELMQWSTRRGQHCREKG